MKNLLNKPLTRLETFPKQLKYISLTGVYVFIFFLAFTPFYMKGQTGNMQIVLAFLYALASFLVPLVFISFRSLLKLPYFDKSKWTVGKEILFAGLIIIPTSFLYLLIDIQFNGAQLNFESYFTALKEVIFLAFFPILLIMILKMNMSLRLKKENSYLNSISHQIAPAALSDNKAIVSDPKIAAAEIPIAVWINSENKSDGFELAIASFNYANSEGNYIDVYYTISGVIQKKTVRSTLKQLQVDFNNHSSVVQCHRSYLVNVEKITFFEGNSRGYKIQFSEDSSIIPVSRNYISSVKKAINQPF